MGIFRCSFAACIPLIACAGFAAADFVLKEDTFSYPNGNLVGNGGWANHSGTGNFVPVANGAILLAQGSGSREDVNLGLGATMATGDVWRFEFDLIVNGTADASPDVYFAHFKDTGTGFNSRIFVAAPNAAGGNFTFGLAENSGVSVRFANDFSFGTSYRVFAEYNYNLGNSRLWIDDIANGFITSTDVDPNQPMTAMAFRQSTGNTSMVIDNLVVRSITAVPEPSSHTMIVTAVCGLVVLPRRRAKTNRIPPTAASRRPG